LQPAAAGAILSPPRLKPDVRLTTFDAGVYSKQRISLMTPKSAVIESNPKVLHGTPVFVGTRVPAQSLFDYLEAGDSLDEFLRQFPSVKREQAIAALEQARDSVLTSARPA
jgi:uncharacterized protein (DUF433 family)